MFTHTLISLSSTPERQSGAALITTLIFLLVLTVIGVVAFSSGILSGKSSSNNQQRMATFYSSESAAGGLLSTFSYDPNEFDEIMDLADYNDLQNHTSGKSYCVDENGALIEEAGCDSVYLDGINLKALVTVYYRGCQEARCVGYGEKLQCHFFEVNSTGWIDVDENNVLDSNEVATEIERVAFIEGDARSCRALTD